MFDIETMARQGYVPKTCTLNADVVYALIYKAEDPCGGCSESRNICKGRPPVSQEDWNVAAQTHVDIENKVLLNKEK